jgi:O-antigen/teichoic acid export membrane protein
MRQAWTISGIRQAVSKTGLHIYVLGSVLTTGVPFLLLPVLLRKLSPAEYGLVAIYQVLQLFCTLFIGLNFEAGLACELASCSTELARKYVSTALASSACTSFAIALCASLFLWRISSISQFPQEWFWAVLASAWAQQMVMIACTVAQMLGKPARYTTFRVAAALTEISTSLVLVCILSYGWRGRVIGSVMGWSVGALIGVGWLMREGLAGFRLDIECLKRLARVGVPAVPHALAGYCWGWGDRLVLSQLLSLREVGIYAVASQAAAAMNVLSTSVHLAWLPWLYRRLAPDQDRRSSIGSRVLALQAAWLLGAILYGLVLTGVFRFGPVGGYRQASGPAMLLALGWGTNAMYKIASGFVFYARRTGWLSVSTILSASCSLLLMKILVPIFGMNGAAIGFLVGSLMMLGMSSILAHRFYPREYPVGLPFRKETAPNNVSCVAPGPNLSGL